MDVLVEVCIVEPPITADDAINARNWKVGDIVDVRGIKPALATTDGNGDYIPVMALNMNRTAYLFVKNINVPALSIEKLKRVICRPELSAIDSIETRRSVIGLTLDSTVLTELQTNRYATINVLDLFTRARFKTAARNLAVGDLS